jgi:hypothetical protein
LLEGEGVPRGVGVLRVAGLTVRVVSGRLTGAEGSDQGKEGMMRVVGIDLSLTKTAVVDLDTRDETGKTFGHRCFGYPLPEDSAYRQQVERLLDISRELTDHLCNRLRVPASTKIGIEGPSFGSKGSAVVELGKIHGEIPCRIYSSGYTHLTSPSPSTCRASVLGRGWGNKKKSEIRRELLRRGYRFKNMDVMDAWVVAMHIAGLEALDTGC